MSMLAFGTPPKSFLLTMILTTVLTNSARIDDEKLENALDKLFFPVGMRKPRVRSLTESILQSVRQKM